MAGWEFSHGDAVRRLATGGAGEGPADTPTMPAGPSAAYAMRPNHWPSGSSPKTLGQGRADAGPRSSRTTKGPAECAGASSSPRKEARASTTLKATHPCQPPPSEGTCVATRRNPSCSGPKPWSTRLDRRRCPEAGQLPQRFPMRLPTNLMGRPSRCPMSRRTQWQRPGKWTTTSSAPNSLDTDATPGGTPTLPTLLPVEDGPLAVQPPGDRPRPGLVGPAHRVQRAPGRWRGHQSPVAARRKDACLPPRDLRQGAHAPLPGPLA